MFGLTPTSAPQVLQTVRDTFVSRNYHWESDETLRAAASAGGRPVSDATLLVAQRLRVGITIDPQRHRLTLSMHTTGAAYSAAGGGLVSIRLAAQHRSIVKAVRLDLAAATRPLTPPVRTVRHRSGRNVDR